MTQSIEGGAGEQAVAGEGLIHSGKSRLLVTMVVAVS